MKLTSGRLSVADYFMMYIVNWKRAVVLLLTLWIVVTYLVISPLKCGGGGEDVTDYQERLRAVSAQLESLKQQHNNLIAQIRRTSEENGNLKDIDTGSLLFGPGQGPTIEYEDLRRRIHSNTKELWYYINYHFRKAMFDDNKLEAMQAMLDNIDHRKRTLLSDLDQLPELDSHRQWRQHEAANVSDLVQRRLHYLQNPPDCKEARKVVCKVNKGCGFGCQLHHIVYCLIFAYATERTLILKSEGWRYNTKGWEYVFYPISETCTSTYNDKIVPYPDSDIHYVMNRRKAAEKIATHPAYVKLFSKMTFTDKILTYDAKVVSLPFIDSLARKPAFLPQAVPRDLAPRILRFNGDPPSWWVGQMVKYVMKLRPETERKVNETMAKMNAKSPFVGVHIRRTDKVGTEAAFHNINEYMSHVQEYFDRLKLTQPVDVMRVYLATDDANALEDARRKYPDYEFIGDASIAKAAATHRRYNPLSLMGLFVDLHMLARSDYIVCTFSSQVGRLAYEMMQANRVDASNSFFSLDDIYYYGGQNPHDRKAIMSHKAADKDAAAGYFSGKSSGEIPFEVGDIIGIAGNHWNGYGRGTNRRTNQNGLIPWYKTTYHLVQYPFPEYKQVPLYSEKRSVA